MVIIQSSSSDRSTNDIIDWLMYHSSNFVRLNDDIIIGNLEITLETGQLLLNNIDISDCSYLYRRGDFHLLNEFIPISHVDKKDNWILAQQLSKESLPILDFINLILKDKNYISNNSDTEINKLEQLKAARMVGLSTPKTIVSNDFDSIYKFLGSESIITKSLSNALIQLSYSSIWSIRILLTTTMIHAKPSQQRSRGLPALFQQYVKKKHELRIFYLKGEFFAKAIFSQQSEKTKVDYRNYDVEKPNRNVPYKLPKLIEKRLHRFMKFIDMDCGSIDMYPLS